MQQEPVWRFLAEWALAVTAAMTLWFVVMALFHLAGAF